MVSDPLKKVKFEKTIGPSSVLISFLPFRKKYFRSFGNINIVDVCLDVTPVFRPNQTDVINGFKDQVSHRDLRIMYSEAELEQFLNELSPRSLVIFFRPPQKKSDFRNLIKALVTQGHCVWFLENKRMILLPAGILQDIKYHARPVVHRLRALKKTKISRPVVHKLLTNDTSICAEMFSEFEIQEVCLCRQMDAIYSTPDKPKSALRSAGIFLDDNLPFHPEHACYSEGLNVKQYYSGLQACLEAICLRFGLSEIAFSRHPNSDGRELNFLDWQPIMQFQTHERAAESSLIFSSGSYSTGIGPQLHIPTYVLIMPDVTPESWVSRQRTIAAAFGAGVIEYTFANGLTVFSSGWGLSRRLRQRTWRRFYARRSCEPAEYVRQWLTRRSSTKSAH